MDLASSLSPSNKQRSERPSPHWTCIHQPASFLVHRNRTNQTDIRPALVRPAQDRPQPVRKRLWAIEQAFDFGQILAISGSASREGTLHRLEPVDHHRIVLNHESLPSLLHLA